MAVSKVFGKLFIDSLGIKKLRGKSCQLDEFADIFLFQYCYIIMSSLPFISL